MNGDDVLREFAAGAARDIGRQLAAASAALDAALLTHLATAGHPEVRLSHFAVLGGLRPGGTRLSALAQHAGMSRQGITALAREVAALGYLTIRVDPDDRRAQLVELTDRGVELCRIAIAGSAALTAAFAARWGADGLEELLARLRDIREHPPAPPAA